MKEVVKDLQTKYLEKRLRFDWHRKCLVDDEGKTIDFSPYPRTLSWDFQPGFCLLSSKEGLRLLQTPFYVPVKIKEIYKSMWEKNIQIKISPTLAKTYLCNVEYAGKIGAIVSNPYLGDLFLSRSRYGEFSTGLNVEIELHWVEGQIRNGIGVKIASISERSSLSSSLSY